MDTFKIAVSLILGWFYHLESTVIFLGTCLGGKFVGVRKAGIGFREGFLRATGGNSCI